MEEIIKKLKEHDEQFDIMAKKFDIMTKKLEEHDDQLDIIARTVAEHTDRLDSIDGKLDGMVTKIDDISRIMNVLDEYVGMTKKKDQELVAVNFNIREIDDRVVVLENDVKQMKPALGLS